MSELDTLMFEWLGDTLSNVLLFNLALTGPASFAMGHGLAITWRPVSYTHLTLPTIYSV